MIRKSILSIAFITLLLISCGAPSVPENATSVNSMPEIYPDYTEVTVPVNICPLNFCVTGSEEAVARITAGDVEYVCGEGCDVIIDEGDWRNLCEAAKGKSMKMEVFGKFGGEWKAYQSFSINVAEDEIDSYISYRLIQPSYVAYEDLSIAQRNLTTFDETAIYDNRTVSREATGQCINCHSYQNYGTDRMLFHMRQGFGGTMIYSDGELRKVDLKTDSTISAGVYPSWHPTLNLVAFSTNKTGQSFHTKDVRKIEVQDTQSDLILYDVEKNEVSIVANDENEFEVFPTWSPDGKTLYYCSAHFEYKDTISNDMEVAIRYKDVKYSIYSMPFDEKTRTFGERKMVYDAAADSLSATLPRISPDGRYMVFSLGEFGCFHVWHDEADIYLLDLQASAQEGWVAKPVLRNLTEINSEHSESYPSFSSNGRWIMADSRRDDGNYTRPVISYFDKQGKCHKAFMLPQKDPHFYASFVRSYNRPEFMKEAVKVPIRDFAAKAKTDAVKAKLR